MQEKRRESRKQRTGQVSGVQVMFATILSVGLILAINFSSRISEGQPLQEAYSRVLTEIDNLTAEHARLTALRDYVLGDAYVEQWARSDGKMVLPGEVLIVPVPSSASMTQEPEPQFNFDNSPAPPQQTPPWQLWWQIFFDSPPPNLSTGG
jgi:cell division protein FtsB